MAIGIQTDKMILSPNFHTFFKHSRVYCLIDILYGYYRYFVFLPDMRDFELVEGDGTLVVVRMDMHHDLHRVEFCGERATRAQAQD